MDFQMFKRRELQALCKLNKIPANITNLAIIHALNSLPIVVGIEDMMKPSESSETAESSVESPARTEIMSPRVPRTSYRTSTRQKPVREEAESVQTVTRTTRQRQIAGEVEEAKTATVPKTPAAASTRRRAPAASARKNMETQMKESEEDEKIEESMDQEKKNVPETPAAAVPSSRRKVPAPSTTRKVTLKEDIMYGRTYSTRRSARLTEVKIAEPSPVKKESKKLEKIDSSATQSFEEMLDEGSDGFNAVAEDSSLSGSSNMEVDVIPSDIQNPSELNKSENIDNPDSDMGSEETITEVLEDKNGTVDDIASEIEIPSENSKLENVEKFSSHEDMDSVVVAAAEIGNDAKNSSETLKKENVSAFEDMDSDEKTAVVTENAVLEINVKNPNELEKTCNSLAEEPLVDVEKSESAAQDENEEDFEFPIQCPIKDLEIESANENEPITNISGDFSSFSLTTIPNTDQSGAQLEQLTKDVEMEDNNVELKKKKGLNETSLRQLTKMLKNKLQINTNDASEEANITTTRAALQTLSNNSLAATQVGN